MFGITFAVLAGASADEILLDEHGCHYTGQGANYHCHPGDFAGRTFPERLRMLMARRDVEFSGATDQVLPDPPRVASGVPPASERP